MSKKKLSQLQLKNWEKRINYQSKGWKESLKRCDVFSKKLQLKRNSFTDSSLKSTVQIIYDVSLSGGIGNKDEILKNYITIQIEDWSLRENLFGTWRRNKIWWHWRHAIYKKKVTYNEKKLSDKKWSAAEIKPFWFPPGIKEVKEIKSIILTTVLR